AHRENRRAPDADRSALAVIEQAAAGWRRRFGVRERDSGVERGSSTAVGDLLVHAFPDRVARQDANDPRRYRLSNGRGAHLHQNTQLYGERWLVVVDLRYDERDSLILSAAPFDADLLERDFADRFVRERIVRWNAETRSVEAFEQRRFAEL